MIVSMVGFVHHNPNSGVWTTSVYPCLPWTNTNNLNIRIFSCSPINYFTYFICLCCYNNKHSISIIGAYGVFVSQLIRYARVCSTYEDIQFRGSILVSKLLRPVYSSRKIHTTFRKFYGHHTNIVHKFDTSVSHMLKSLSCESWRVPHVE